MKSNEELLAEERDYKRRRMSYRGKKMKRLTTETRQATNIIMAETDETEPPATVETAEELKRRLQSAVKSIVEGDDYTVDSAMITLSALKDLKFNPSLSVSSLLGVDHPAIPHQFLCPISNQLIRDPVILATGQTYDRSNIEKWLKDGHRTCPRTQQLLSNTNLTPNLLVRQLISKWCKEGGIHLQVPVQETDEAIKDKDLDHFYSLLDKLTSLSDQKAAAKEIRLITKHLPSSRAVFGECPDTIFQLLHPLSPGMANAEPDLQEDIITTVLNISIHENNKKLIAENELVMSFLVESVESGTMETRSNAAAAIFTLSALDSNKIIIGNMGALGPLIVLLDEGNPQAMKDAASAMFNLCIILENKERAVREGAVRVIMKKIKERILIDELLVILAMLCSHQMAIEEIVEIEAVPCLLSVIRAKTNQRTLENCIAIIYAVCLSDRSILKVIAKDELSNMTMSYLSHTGTARAKRKANGILEKLMLNNLLLEQVNP